MTSVIDALPEPARSTMVDVLGRRAPQVLAELRVQESPSRAQQAQVDNALSMEITSEMDPDDDWQPSPRGLAAEDAIDAFYAAFPAGQE